MRGRRGRCGDLCRRRAAGGRPAPPVGWLVRLGARWTPESLAWRKRSRSRKGGRVGQKAGCCAYNLLGRLVLARFRSSFCPNSDRMRGASLSGDRTTGS